MNNTGMNSFVLRSRPPALRRRSPRRLPALQVALARRWWQWRITSDEKLKRAFDIAFSATVLLCISPLLAAIALLIKLEDGGPIFFRQIRVGRHGREFIMFKFRSMRVDAEQRLRELLALNQHKAGVTFK